MQKSDGRIMWNMVNREPREDSRLRQLRFDTSVQSRVLQSPDDFIIGFDGTEKISDVVTLQRVVDGFFCIPHLALRGLSAPFLRFNFIGESLEDIGKTIRVECDLDSFVVTLTQYDITNGEILVDSEFDNNGVADAKRTFFALCRNRLATGWRVSDYWCLVHIGNEEMKGCVRFSSAGAALTKGRV